MEIHNAKKNKYWEVVSVNAVQGYVCFTSPVPEKICFWLAEDVRFTFPGTSGSASLYDLNSGDFVTFSINDEHKINRISAIRNTVHIGP